MRDDKYINALKRELAGRGKRNPAAAEEILRELARAGGEVETRAPKAPRKTASKPKADEAAGSEE